MGIKCKTTQAQIDKMIRERIELVRRKIISKLNFVGTEAVKYAKLHGNYQDQTGNLRSSIGYCIVECGKVGEPQKFEQVAAPKPSDVKGTDIGTEYVLTLAQHYAQEYPNDIVLVVVAGMNYATHVERLDNYQVLSGAKLEAETLLQQVIKDLKK